MVNKKGNAQVVLIIVIIALFLIATGIITIPNLDKFLAKHNYVSDVQVNPQNITKYQSTEISFIISNPKDTFEDVYLNVSYDKNVWDTNKYDLKRNEKIYIGRINPKESQKYSITFEPNRYTINTNFDHIFIITLYDEENKLLDNYEVLVYVKE